jgi:enoyl-CoA hydratase/carnithine racemase
VPEAGSSLLVPAVAGRQQAFALLGLGEPFTAERAQAAGLIYKVVPEDRLETEVFAAADALAAKPPEALRIARDLMLGDRDVLVARIREESAHFRARLKSAEARDAFMAFMSRKK